MSTTLELPHKVNRALSGMGMASKAAAKLFTLAALDAPAERPGGPARPDPDTAPGWAKTAQVSRADEEARLLVAMAKTFLSLAKAARLPAPLVDLEAFAAFLQAHGILSESLDYSADEGILQKCAFIAQEGFGLNLGYDYHIHAYGTFSSFIMADFAAIAKRKARASGSPMPPQFREGEFLALVSKRDIDWLCVASMVVHERASYGPGELGRHVERMSASHNRGLVKGVIGEVDAALGPPRRAPARA